MIQVMLIDDSAVVRQTLTEVLSQENDIEILCTAADPYDAAEKLKRSVPDVIILDIEMPRMDGLTFLKKLMNQHPISVIICSSMAEQGSNNVFQALQFGAVDIIQKPKIGTKQFLLDSRVLISDAVRAAAVARVEKLVLHSLHSPAPKLTADVIMPRTVTPVAIETTESVIVVGASTGGTEAIRVFLEGLPIDCPGVVIVQHMPEHFTASFAKRLDSICVVSVKEAENNDSILRGRVLIAPGGSKHTLIKRSGYRYYVELKEGPLVSRHRPSVDVLFRSTARYAGKNAIGVLMTGMGDDGARGLLEMKETGSLTIAQDEESCVVFGMPREAIKNGAVSKILPLKEIADFIIKKVHN